MDKNKFEIQCWEKDKIVCGIDEVGRGPLFGPIMLGCVILPTFCENDLLVDSKTLSRPKLELASAWISKNTIFETIMIDPWIIDQRGINVAIEIAINRLIFIIQKKINKPISLVLIDLVKIKITSIAGAQIITKAKGESWSSSIAAASIIAKTTRDKMITSISKNFPAYSLEKNKGYGSAYHCKKILEKKASLLHRKSYCRNFEK